MATLRVKRRRNRFAAAAMQGVGICLVGYIPAWRWGNPMIPVGMTSLMMILVAARMTSVRQGFVRGLILGTFAGIWIWAGMATFHDNYVKERVWQTEPHEIPQPKADGGGAAAKADSAEANDATGEAKPAAEPPKMTEVLPYTQEERDKDEAHRRRLPYLTIPPPMVICPVIGMVFANLAGKRRAKVRSMWD